jgi:hypothetical protein
LFWFIKAPLRGYRNPEWGEMQTMAGRSPARTRSRRESPEAEDSGAGLLDGFMSKIGL